MVLTDHGLKILLWILGLEFADVGADSALFGAILCKGLVHLWVLICRGVLEQLPPQQLRGNS